MPHGFAISKYDALVYNSDCSLDTSKAKKDFGFIADDLREDGGVFIGYKSNYMCMLKRIKQLVNFLNINDPNALIFFQADHGIEKEGIVDAKEILTLAKLTKECEKFLSKDTDNINAIRLMLSCATGENVKFVKKRSYSLDVSGNLIRLN